MPNGPDGSFQVQDIDIRDGELSSSNTVAQSKHRHVRNADTGGHEGANALGAGKFHRFIEW